MRTFDNFIFSATSEHCWFVSLAFLEIFSPVKTFSPSSSARFEQIAAKITLLAQICLQYVNRNTSAHVKWICETEIHQHKYIDNFARTNRQKYIRANLLAMLQQSFDGNTSAQIDCVNYVESFQQTFYDYFFQVCHWNRFCVLNGSSRPVPWSEGGESQWMHEGQSKPCATGLNFVFFVFV